MAELLIKAVDANHQDPAKDARGCYKRGDIIAVRPDGFEWGGLEKLAPANGGKFVIVKIADATVAQVNGWLNRNWGVDAESPDTARRRRVKIEADSLPVNARTSLNITGQLTTTWAALRQFVRDKKTNATATGATL